MTDVLYERAEGIATITLNRADKHNAFTLEMAGTWGARLEEAQVDPEVRVVVVTAKGNSFCAGADVGDLDAATRASTPIGRKLELQTYVHRIPLALQVMDKPVICAVNGAAVGAGMDLTLGCDLRIASETARFSEAYVRVGLVPGAGGCFFLPRLVGLPRALELLLTGRWVDAREAEGLGLVNEVVPAAELMPRAYALARDLAAGPTIAQRLIKRTVYESLQMDLRTHLDLVSSHLGLVAATEDHAEGARAFLERRRPQFHGR